MAVSVSASQLPTDDGWTMVVNENDDEESLSLSDFEASSSDENEAVREVTIPLSEDKNVSVSAETAPPAPQPENLPARSEPPTEIGVPIPETPSTTPEPVERPSTTTEPVETPTTTEPVATASNPNKRTPPTVVISVEPGIPVVRADLVVPTDSVRFRGRRPTYLPSDVFIVDIPYIYDADDQEAGDDDGDDVLQGFHDWVAERAGSIRNKLDDIVQALCEEGLL